MADFIRIGKPDPKVESFVDGNGIRHIVFPWRSRNLCSPYLDFQNITYHPYSNEVWLWTRELSDFTDWDSFINMAMTLKADYSIGLRVRGANMTSRDTEQRQKSRFDFEVLL